MSKLLSCGKLYLVVSYGSLTLKFKLHSASDGKSLTTTFQVCDVKFSDEGTLQKHHTHDHCLSAEMQQLMKSRATSQQQQSANHEKSSSLGSGSGASTGDKFSQLCMYCKQMFKTKGELEKHMKTHVLPSNQKCNICDEVFPSAMILAEHKLTHCKVGY